MTDREEAKFQAKFIKNLKARFPGCIILKNDANYIQGFPDLTIFYKDKWAVIECKRSATAPYRPNQELYLEQTNRMSFSTTAYPENEEEVLNELEQAFGTD